MFVYQHQRSDNDPNGNPQRLWIVWRVGTGEYAETVAVIDEGYGDFPRDRWPAAMELSPVRIPKSEYHRVVRWARGVQILESR